MNNCFQQFGSVWYEISCFDFPINAAPKFLTKVNASFLCAFHLPQLLGDYRLSRVRYHLLGLAYWTAGSAYCRGSWNGGNLMYDNGLLSSMSSDW